MLKSYKAGFLVKAIMLTCIILSFAKINAQVYYHNFGTGTINTQVYTVAPVTISPNLSQVSWTNSSNAWSDQTGNTGKSIVMAGSGTLLITLKLTVAPNFQMSVNAFDFWRQRSASGPVNWAMAINGTNVGTGTVPASGASLGNTPVTSSISNLTGQVTITLTLTGSSGGTFRLDDFTLYGSVTSSCGASVTSFSPASGPQGTAVTINGSGFTGATAVKFGGTNATSFAVVDNNTIRAVAPSGTSSGVVSVTASSGCSGDSASSFTPISGSCTPPPTDLFISEVYDQTPNSGGMIELYNASGSTITFTGQYVVKRYQNITDTSPVANYILPLTGSLAAGAVRLIACTSPLTNQCVPPAAEGPDSFGGINENDKIELVKNGNVLDVAHLPPSQPGFDIIRKPDAVVPSSTYIASDWDVTLQANQTFPNTLCSNLGSHTIAPANSPTITQPVSQAICSGGNTTFTVSLSNPSGFTYQWKVLNASGNWVNVTNGTNYSGATTATLTISNAPVSFSGNQYYVQMTSSTCSLPSNAIQLSVSAAATPAASVTQQPDCTTPTGTITITSPTGQSYSVDGTNYVSTMVFSGLSPNTYTIYVKTAGGCVSTLNNLIINSVPSAPATPVASVTQQPDCTTATGTITVTSPTGQSYSVDGTNYVSTMAFSGLAAATYTVYVKNAAGCVSQLSGITINPQPATPATPIASATQQPDCTTATGTITITSPMGQSYSVDGTNYVSTMAFSGLAAGTYTVYVKNAAGCVSSLNNIVINPAPSAPATPVASATQQPDCTTATGTITVTSPTGQSYSVDGTNYVSTTVFSGLAAGTYTVYVKNAAGCVSQLSGITINPQPATPSTPAASVTQQPDCTTTTGTITITSPTGQSYSVDGTNYVSTMAFSGLAAGTYTVYVKNAAGCVSQLSGITINPQPATPATPVASVTQQPTCTTATGTITIISPMGQSYSVDGTSYVSTTVFSGLAAGTYTVYVKNAAGCVSSLNNIVINPAPSAPAAPVASATQQPDCTIATGTITVTSPTGQSYSVDGTNYVSTMAFSGLAAGTYTVYVKNAAGCVSSLNNIVINPQPATPATPVASATQQPDCTTATGTITVTSPTGQSYSVDGTNYVSTTVFSGLVAGTYTVYVKNAAGCVSQLSGITINPQPATPATPVASATQQPDCTNATGAITVTSPTGQSYSVDGTNYVSTTVFSGLVAGTYTVYVKNAAGCVSQLSGITINPQPATPATPVASATQQPDCTTATGTITITSPTGLSYSVDGTNYVSTMAFSGLPAGSYTVYVKNAAGCVSQLSGITINPQPATPATPVASATQQPDCTTATGTITITSPTGQSYSVDGTNYVSTMAFSGLAAGSYTVYVKNGAGCVSQLSGITINPQPATPATPVASATQQPDCTTATGTITITSPTGQSYSVDGTNYVSTMTFSGLSAGTYTVYVKNAAGCVSQLSGITINPQPATPATPLASVTQQPTCTTATGTITVTSPTGQSYSVDGTNYVSTTVFSGLPAGSYTVYVKNAAGCVSQLSGITINPQPATPATPVASATQQPDCTTATGTITVTSPTGQSYSVDGTNYVSTMAFSGLAAGTYTVYVKNAAGCVSQLSGITINPGPAAPTIPVASVTQQPDCTTATGTITVSAPAGMTYSIDGVNYGTSMSFSGLAPGSYTVYVKNAGCVSSLSGIAVNTQPATPPAPTFTVSQPTCQITGGSVAISSPIGNFTYSINGGPFQASPNFNGLAQGTYTVVARSVAGCVSPASALITINAQPQVPASPLVSVIQPTCATATGTITVNSPIGAGLTYSIDNVNFQSSPTFANIAAGNYTVRVKNADGCMATAPAVINTQPATPAVPLLSAVQPGCSQATGSITVNSPTGAGLTYSLDGGAYQASTVFNAVPPGSHTVTVKNSSGCTATSSPLTINPAPVVPASPTASVTQQPSCATPTGTITITAPTGAGLQYSVDGITYSSGTTFTGLVSGTYTVYVKNASGCTATRTGLLVNPQPATPGTPLISVVQPTCNTATGSVTVTTPLLPSLTYSINGGAYQSSPSFTGLSAGTYTITVKNAAGCISAASASVTINPQPTTPAAPTIVSTQPDCTTATGTITINAPVGTGLEYSINGTTWQTTNVFSGLVPGLYTVRVRNSDGCSSQAQTRIMPQPSTPAVPVYTLVQPNCSTATGTITVTSPSGAYTYSVDGTTFLPSRSFSGLAPGTYTITVKNNAGCTSVSGTITIDAPPAPAPSPGTITGSSAVCSGGTVQLTNTATGGTWSSSNTNIATVDSNGLVTTLFPGSVVIRYTTGTVCTATATHALRVDSLPNPMLPAELVTCIDNTTNIGSPVTIATNMSSTIYSFTWKKNGAALPDTTSSITVTEPATYEVTVTNIATGCTATDETVVKGSSLAIAYAEVTQDFDFRQTITVYVTGGIGNYTYSLNDGPYQDSPVFSGIYQGEYTIKVKDDFCGEIALTVYALNYPRFFSPNGDGNNDRWNIEGLVTQQNARIYIFDRFGKIVSSIKPNGPGWDGMYNGERLPATDYWFTLQYISTKGEEKEFKAHFSLIR